MNFINQGTRGNKKGGARNNKSKKNQKIRVSRKAGMMSDEDELTQKITFTAQKYREVSSSNCFQ